MILFLSFFSFVCDLFFFVAVVVDVVVIVVMFLSTYFFYIYRLYTSGRGRALVPSVIPTPLCNDLKNCERNSANSDIGYIRSKRGTVQP